MSKNDSTKTAHFQQMCTDLIGHLTGHYMTHHSSRREGSYAWWSATETVIFLKV